MNKTRTYSLLSALQLLAMIVAAFSLTGCVTTEQQRQDLVTVQSYNVKPTVYDKMVRRAPLLVEDVAYLGSRHVDPDLIIRYLRARETVYPLTVAQVNKLQRAGVSSRVIDYMLTTEKLFGVDTPPYNVYYGVGFPYGTPGYYGYPWGYDRMPLVPVYYRGYYHGRGSRD